MLTPEFLNAIEFNKVVQLYNQLNIDIVADIIERVSQMQEITNTTKYQLKVLLQTNGTEIFNYALQETSSLTAETKKALRELFEEVGAEDIESYKELYEYRDVPYKLSETQYKILNQGLKVTNNTLKNLTNSIAFASKQAYVNTVDSAYMQAMSGAISYTKAIETAVQKLANQGITLKDSLGRNVQLEVAVRRNVLAGIRDTARALDKDISDYLGCDGYEVTAHTGARPTHAAAQGKQYALTKEKAKEYNVGLWSDVVDLWSEYNCRHDYFGIILGISEPVYDNDELTEMENATVMYKGKEIPYYEATQKQRALENSIRKTKRSIQTLQKAGQDFTNQQTKLTKLQKQYTDFCNETGLNKEYNRLNVAKTSLTLNEQNAINKYISSDFYTINEKLRNGVELSYDENILVKNMDSALSKLSSYKGLVTRSLTFNSNEELQEFLNEHQIDRIVTYPAYTSTTAGERYNDAGQVELYIYSKNGKNMIKYNGSEQEILYTRNSTFKVKEIDITGNVYHILLEEINE